MNREATVRQRGGKVGIKEKGKNRKEKKRNQ